MGQCLVRAGRLAGLIILVSVSFTGCGGPPAIDKVNTVPFKGTVTLDGKPLPYAKVTFMPDGNNKNPSAEGAADAAGKFELTTSIGPNRKPGAGPGDYKVVISQFLAPNGSPQDPAKPAEIPGKEALPDKFSNLSKTELKATIPAAGGEQNFDLKSI